MLSNSFNLYYLLAILICLGTGFLAGRVLYPNNNQLNKRLRYTLMGLRTIVMASLLWLLFSPLIRNVFYTLEKPIIVIGQDNSLSIRSEGPNFNKAKYERDMKTLKDELSKKFDVRTYHFSDKVKKDFDFANTGKLTNASNFIRKLNDELLNRNVGAVIIATDGIFNRGGNPLYDLAKLKAPVYTIALGDTIPKRDLLIADINYNNLVYLDNDFTVEVQVQAFKLKGQPTQLSVFENDKKVYSTQILLSENSFVKDIPVKLKASKLGLRKYTFALSTIKDEVSTKNNDQSIFVDVIDDRQKVLIAAASPHPDLTALKQAIGLNKHYEAKIILSQELNSVNVADYGLVILYQLPGMQFNTNSFIQRVQSGKASLLYVLGAQTNISTFNQVQRSVTFFGDAGILQESFPEVNPNFTSFTIEERAKQIIAQYDPLQAPSGKLNINTSHTDLLVQRVGKTKTDIPQLFFTLESGRKVGYLIGEGLWRWKLSEAKNGLEYVTFNQLISQTVQFLSVKEDKRKFKVYTLKSTFDESEPVILNAALYNDSYVPVNTPDVNIQIKGKKNKTYNFTFLKSASAYRLDAGLLPPGDYSYVASTEFGNKKYTERGAFFVNPLIVEYQQTIADHHMLYNMSAQTNGKMYMPKDVLRILEDLDKNEGIKTLSYEDRRYEDIINFKWLFGAILLLLTLEWFFRKRNGEI